MKKIRVAIVFGGKSPEHEVSIVSAGNVLKALSTSKYSLVRIAINTQGRWFKISAKEFLFLQKKGKFTPDVKIGNEVSFLAGRDSRQCVELNGRAHTIDVALPILHGSFGEDGTVQGLLELAGIPFVGPGVFASAACMDKSKTKSLLRQKGLNVADWIDITPKTRKHYSYELLQKKLGSPVFVKPSRTGSSVGVHKVASKSQLSQALSDAFQYDEHLLVEEAIEGREVECAVLGNANPRASRVGEVVPKKAYTFYSYSAKYIDPDGAALHIPAIISPTIEKKVQEISKRAYEATQCEGMSRVDCFVTKSGKVFVNEINTIPGFTSISMYPKLWEISGLSYAGLIDSLIALAFERKKRENARRSTFDHKS